MGDAGEVLPDEYPSTDMIGRDGVDKPPRWFITALGLGLAAVYAFGVYAGVKTAVGNPDEGPVAWAIISAFMMVVTLHITYLEVSADE